MTSSPPGATSPQRTLENDFLLLNIRTALLTFGGRTHKVGMVDG